VLQPLRRSPLVLSPVKKCNWALGELYATALS
jgi:hypothetical protein